MKIGPLLAAIAVLSILAGCVQAAERTVPLKPSELNARPAHYNGKIVLVRGFVTLVPEGHNLYESKNLNREFRQHIAAGGKDDFHPQAWDKYCLTIANPGLLYKHQADFNGTTVTIKGKFIDDYLNARTIDLGACPLPTAIIIDYADLRRRYPSRFHDQ
jgi:hypothetical protein